jgi:hypothetical protein
MQDHKFIVGEAVDHYFRKHDKIQSMTVEQALDEMIFARQV